MTRQQEWSRKAYAKVSGHKGKDDEKKYRTLCMKMPILVLQSGLVQALAFIRSREKEVGKNFCDDLAEVYGINGNEKGKTAMTQAQEADDLSLYLAMTRDIIEVSTWFQRFAQSELAPGEDA